MEHPVSDAEIESFLSAVRTVAVVGLSDNPARPSYDVASYLLSQGYEILPVNPNLTEVLGRRAYPSLQEASRSLGGRAVDLVDVFRRSEEAPDLAEEAILIGAKGIWLQLGVESQAAEERARHAGLFTISNRCVKKEHQRLFGRGKKPDTAGKSVGP